MVLASILGGFHDLFDRSLVLIFSRGEQQQQQQQQDDGKRRPSLGPSSNMVYYPLGAMDGDGSGTQDNMTLLMRFSDGLDADKLHDSLVRLLQIGHWKKLAARFARVEFDINHDGGDDVVNANMNTKKKLCLAAPRDLGDAITRGEWAAVDYTHVKHEGMSIAEHPLGRKMPVARDQLCLEPSGSDFAEFCHAPGAPANLEELIRTGKPQVGLRVTSFDDATLVSLTVTHALMDGMALKSLMEAWSLVLADREGDVPPVLSPFADAAAPLWRDSDKGDAQSDKSMDAIPRERSVLADKMLGGWSMIRFLINMMWPTIWHKAARRTLFIPASYMAQLRSDAMATLPEGKGVSFVSDTDIICTLFSRLMATAYDWKAPVTMSSMMDLRSRMPDMFDPAGAYLGNLITGTHTFFPYPDIMSASLGELTSRVRLSLMEQSTPAQLRAFFRLVTPMPRGLGRRFCLVGESNSRWVLLSSWLKAKFPVTVDFSPAVVRPGNENDQAAAQGPGRMDHLMLSWVKPAVYTTGVAYILCKDREGNHWVDVTLSDNVVCKFERLLDQMDRDRRRQ